MHVPGLLHCYHLKTKLPWVRSTYLSFIAPALGWWMRATCQNVVCWSNNGCQPAHNAMSGVTIDCRSSKGGVGLTKGIDSWMREDVTMAPLCNNNYLWHSVSHLGLWLSPPGVEPHKLLVVPLPSHQAHPPLLHLLWLGASTAGPLMWLGPPKDNQHIPI